MIAVRSPALNEDRIRINEDISMNLRSLFEVHKVMVELGLTEKATEYRRMFHYLRREQFFDAAYVAKRVGVPNFAKKLGEMQEAKYAILGPVKRGLPE